MKPSERINELYKEGLDKISYYEKTGEFGHIKMTDAYQDAIVKFLDEQNSFNFNSELLRLWKMFCGQLIEQNPNYLDSDFNFDNFISWLNGEQK